VVNATGIVLHTNLGRAPLAEGAAQAAAEAGARYTDLELDLGEGRRGERRARRVRAQEPAFSFSQRGWCSRAQPRLTFPQSIPPSVPG